MKVVIITYRVDINRNINKSLFKDKDLVINISMININDPLYIESIRYLKVQNIF